jgi:hypothetical protein
MTDLRKAAEMALKFCEDIGDLGGPYPAVVSDSRKVLQALRKALAQTEKPPVKSYCGGKPNYCTPEVTPEVTGEVTGEVGACVTCGAPKSEWLVDAVNMSQERVDETAKREHEPWQSVQCTCGGIIYFKHTKREWVGLTDDEIIKCFDSVAFGQVEDDLIINKHVNIFRAIHFIEAKLKEKNT